MDGNTETTCRGYSGKKSDLHDIRTGEKIGTIFVYIENDVQVAHFMKFSEVWGRWCFTEVPDVIADDTELFATLQRQLLDMHITLLPHPNDIVDFAKLPVEPRYVQ